MNSISNVEAIWNACFARKFQMMRDVCSVLRCSMLKKSVLEFVDNCANYKTMLRKHFRGYLELISFSSRNTFTGAHCKP